MADALDVGLDGVAKRSLRLTRQAAGTGFAAGKCARIKQRDTFAGTGEIVGSGTARGTGADDQDLGRCLHGYFGGVMCQQIEPALFKLGHLGGDCQMVKAIWLQLGVGGVIVSIGLS